MISNFEAKKRIAKHRRETLSTGGGKAFPGLSDLEQNIGAIVGKTALLAVPSAEHLDIDPGPMSTVSSPRPPTISESEDNLFFLELIQFDGTFHLKVLAVKPWDPSV